MDKEDKIKNIMRDTRKDVRYIIYADHKLNRKEMLDSIREFNFNPLNIRLKRGTVVEIEYKKR